MDGSSQMGDGGGKNACLAWVGGGPTHLAGQISLHSCNQKNYLEIQLGGGVANDVDDFWEKGDRCLLLWIKLLHKSRLPHANTRTQRSPPKCRLH